MNMELLQGLTWGMGALVLALAGIGLLSALMDRFKVVTAIVTLCIITMLIMLVILGFTGT